MITLVIITLLLYRGAQYNTGHFPFGQSKWAVRVLRASPRLLGDGRVQPGPRDVLPARADGGRSSASRSSSSYSKHLHIAHRAAQRATSSAMPDGLGALLPVTDADGKPIDFADVENLSEDTVFGKGKIEDFTWKGYLDFATCTECGRCQSQCPAWNTDKPLSPKLLIMDLRDHLFAKAPYILGGKTVPDGRDRRSSPTQAARHHGVPESGFPRVEGSTIEQALRPLVGDLASGGVIDPDVLWSCTTCGACVEQCPVDIEHIDHIVDMRRYQVLIESAFPSEAGVMLRNLENKGNPWGMAEQGPRGVDGRAVFEVRRADARHASSTPTSSTCSGSAAPARWRTARRRSPSRSPNCCTSPASSSRCSARARRAPVTRPAGWATSSCSRCWACRTSRR